MRRILAQHFLRRVGRKVRTSLFQRTIEKGILLRLDFKNEPIVVRQGRLLRRVGEILGSADRKRVWSIEKRIVEFPKQQKKIPDFQLLRILSVANRQLRKGMIIDCIEYLTHQYSMFLDARVAYAIWEVLQFLMSCGNQTFQAETLDNLLASLSDSVYSAKITLASLYEKRGMVDEALSLLGKSKAVLSTEQYSLMLQTMLKSPNMSGSALLREQITWATNFCLSDKDKALSVSLRQQPDATKLRIGYHCTFWDTDCIRYQLLSFIKYHNREKYDICCYSSKDVDDFTRAHFEKVKVTGLLDDYQFVNEVRSDEIDIFVECTGFSPGHRFSALAGRCAPIQISYLNHAGTSGTPNVDYVLADEISVRKGEDQYFTERVFRLPGSFFCFDFYDYHPDPGICPVKKNGFITFGCFGSQGKINETLITWWAEILKKVPNSKLYVRNRELSDHVNAEFLRNLLGKYGVRSDRVLLGGGVQRNKLIECYSDVDISLDTWPYCGGNTLAESMWQGVPVVTYRGQRFSSSYGASIVYASGCKELVAETQKEYIDLAVNLSKDKDRIVYYRENLRSLIKNHGFNDSRAFAKKIEQAFAVMMGAQMRVGEPERRM
jgi:predicted O-linked N-acetylglucosamine transferase (SPINDLY family)